MNYLSVSQAAKELGMSPDFIRKKIREGDLVAVKVSSRKYKIRQEDWDNYIESKVSKGEKKND